MARPRAVSGQPGTVGAPAARLAYRAGRACSWPGKNVSLAHAALRNPCLPCQVISSLLDLRPTVVRGNASEILALAGLEGATKGVDSTAAATGAAPLPPSVPAWLPGLLGLARSLFTYVHGRLPPARCCAAEALEAAKQLAARHGCVVAVSGPEDLVTDGVRVLKVANGVPMLQQITATGCSGGWARAHAGCSSWGSPNGTANGWVCVRCAALVLP